MLSADAPVVLLLHGGLDNLAGKTGLAMLSYRQGPVVAVVDPAHAGADLEAITGRAGALGGRVISPGIVALGEQAGWLGASRALQLADPDGHRLQLLQD